MSNVFHGRLSTLMFLISEISPSQASYLYQSLVNLINHLSILISMNGPKRVVHLLYHKFSTGCMKGFQEISFTFLEASIEQTLSTNLQIILCFSLSLCFTLLSFSIGILEKIHTILMTDIQKFRCIPNQFCLKDQIIQEKKHSHSSFNH